MDETKQLLLLMGVLAALSLPACVYLAMLRVDRGCFLHYQPRWPVPWGAVGGVIAFALVLLTALDQLSAKLPADKLDPDALRMGSAEYVQVSLVSFAASLGLVGILGFFLASATGATLADLGIDFNGSRVMSDIRAGVLAALASLLPVYTISMLLVIGLRIEAEHPTLQRLASDPNPMVLIATLLTAGLAAPIFEEFIFRLMLQGWLERMEDESLGLTGRMEEEELQDDQKKEQEDAELEQSHAVEDALPDPNNPYASPMAQALLRMHRRHGQPPKPPEFAFGGLPHGWGPVLVSSFLFALVHFGQGAAPIPLFFFALVLGYLYQRTHRLAPSIAAHMTFNVISLVITWFQAQ